MRLSKPAECNRVELAGDDALRIAECRWDLTPALGASPRPG